MSMVLQLGVCLIVAAGAQSAPDTSLVPPPGYIVIDGSKNPEQIPQWQIWESSLGLLAFVESKGSTSLSASLGMSDADRELVLAAARQYKRSESGCEKRVEQLRPLLGKVEDSVINERTEAIQLECRQATLDAAEALMEALSPEGQASMLSWLEKGKANIRVFVPKAELDHYRRPY